VKAERRSLGLRIKEIKLRIQHLEGEPEEPEKPVVTEATGKELNLYDCLTAVGKRPEKEPDFSKMREVCKSCKGTRTVLDGSACPSCHGEGLLPAPGSPNKSWPPFDPDSDCPTCEGTGWVGAGLSSSCSSCHGSGRK